jgi:hypothetical protein
VPCGVCERPDREEIERRVAGGESVRKVGAAYGLPHALIQRHKRCVSEEAARPEAVKAAQKLLDEYGPKRELPPRPAADGSPIEMVRWLYEAAADVLETTHARGDEMLALRAHQQLRSTVELLAKLLGNLVVKHEHQVVGPGGGPVQIQALHAHVPVELQQLVPLADAGDIRSQRLLDRWSRTDATELPEQIRATRQLLAELEAEARTQSEVIDA